MPNVLLFGGTLELFEAFSADARWNVQRAVHSYKSVSRDLLGDPLDWHLVIDDCARATVSTDELSSPQDFAKVSHDYLAEASRSRMISFPPVGEERYHNYFRAVEPDGFRDLEFNRGNAPEALKLEDFVDAFRSDFYRGRLDHQKHNNLPAEEVLFYDAYGKALIVIRNQILHVLSVLKQTRRLEAIMHLCYRTVPKIWPEVYSDQFRPRRVAELEEERDRVVGELRDRERQYAVQIDKELSYFAPYTALTELADDDLKMLVHKVLAEVFELDVKDLDDGLEEDDDKTLDLLLRHSGLGFIEVRASGDRGAQVIWMERVDEHVETVTEQYGPPDYKVFVFNGRYRRGPEERTLGHLFNRPVVDEATERGICLISTSTLLNAIEVHRAGSFTTDQLVQAFRTPGVFEGPQT